MGFDLSSNSDKTKKSLPKINNSKEKDKTDNLGEEFILEDWQVFNDKNKNIDNSIKFDSDLLISEAKKNPFNDYKEKKLLGEGSFGKVYLVNHKIIGATRAMKIIIKV